MNEKLVRKYIPKKYRDVIITHDFGGMQTAKSILHCGGHTQPSHDLTITPIRGNHQGYTSHTNLFSVGIPNGDMFIVAYPHGSLQSEAKVHISAKTGICTVLKDFSGSQFDNKTWSELFDVHIRHNETDYPYAVRRMGDTQMFEGLQFKRNGAAGGVEFLNPRKDFRVRTLRSVSMPVRRELREVAAVVEGKAQMLRNAHDQSSIAEMAGNMCDHQMFKSMMASYWGANTSLLTKKDATVAAAAPKAGTKLKQSALADIVYDAMGGNPAHVLMSLILAHHNSSRDLIDYAPIWIAARGGYELTEVG